MKKISVVLSILLFASIASANTVEIRLDGVSANGININAFSFKFYNGGEFQYPQDIEDFSFSWANPPQETRVVWTLDNYPFEINGNYLATGYAAFGPGTLVGALKDGSVVTLASTVAKFGINPSDSSNYIYLVGQGNTNAIGNILQITEERVGDNQIITISQASSGSCSWDLQPVEKDGDVDGLDIDMAASLVLPQELMGLAQQFGRTNCMADPS